MHNQESTKVKLNDLEIASDLEQNKQQIPLPNLPTLDEDSPIGRKWKTMAEKLGIAISDVQKTPDGKGTYQQFQGGVIFHSLAFGAQVISRAIYDKWSSLKNTKDAGGNLVKTYLGCPISSSFTLAKGGEAVYYERGMIVVRSNAQAFVVYGMIYVHYRALEGVNGFLGLPLSDEEVASNGGRRARFDGGDIYWRSDIGARVVYGAIRRRWQELGGAGSSFGYPITDEAPIKKDGKEVGRVSQFEKGNIYWSANTGAWEINGDILKTWENEYGGAAGIFGFPISGVRSTPSSGGRFNNFERGILVWHDKGTYAGTYPFMSLEFYMERFGSKGNDPGGIDSPQEISVQANVNASTGETFKKRMPTNGDYGPDEDIHSVLIKVPVVRDNLVINVKLEAWDSDLPFGEEHLGTVAEKYTIDNLWGVLENAEHWDGNFLAVYKLRNSMPVNRSNFRKQLFWQFDNFSTPKLSENQYAQTFGDIYFDGKEDGKIEQLKERPFEFHPFDNLFYNLVYKGMANGGNCFGMCLESIYAQKGRSIFSEPIYRFGPKGDKPNPNNPSHRDIINEINIKHGYQAGAEMIDWFLGKFVVGHTHDPIRAFKESRDSFYRGDYPMLVVTNGYFNVGGHAVLPLHKTYPKLPKARHSSSLV